MSVFRQIAADEVFWATLATVDTALLVAAVIEGRSARDEFLEEHFRRAAERDEEHRAAMERLDKWFEDQGAEPQPPAPSLLKPYVVPVTEQNKRRRGELAALSVKLFAGSLVLALGMLTPVLWVDGLAVVGVIMPVGLMLGGLSLVVIVATAVAQGKTDGGAAATAGVHKGESATSDPCLTGTRRSGPAKPTHNCPQGGLMWVVLACAACRLAAEPGSRWP